MYKQVWEKIKKAEVITIFGHVIPDGDCYGSILGLKNLILASFPNKKVFALGSGLPKYFSLVGMMDIATDEDIKGSLAIVVDLANLARIEDTRYSLASDIIKIDHHQFAEHFGEPEIIKTEFCSATSIIADMADTLNLPITKEAALPLFLGMVTDSGRFLYQPIIPRVYELACKLINTGIDIKSLYDIMYEVDEKILRFKGWCCCNYKKSKNGVIYLPIPKEIIHEFGLDFNTCASMVNCVSGVPGSPIWVFFSESDSGEVRVEFRSKGVPVQPTAVKFGGGGHLQASGCKLDTLEDHTLVVKELDKVLKEFKEACSKTN